MFAKVKMRAESSETIVSCANIKSHIWGLSGDNSLGSSLTYLFHSFKTSIPHSVLFSLWPSLNKISLHIF